MRSLNDILGDLNASMDGMTSEEKANIISTIFNKTDLSSVNALLANTGDTWDELQTSIENSGGAAQQMADTQLDNLSGQLTILKSAVEGFAISIGEALMPTIKKIVEKIQGFVDWLNNLDEGTRQMIVKVGLFVAALGPFLVILGTIISKVGVAMQAFSSLGLKLTSLISSAGGASGGLGGLGAAIGGISAPVVAVVAVIGTLVAAFVYLWKTNEEFRSNIIAIWERIKSVFEGFAQGIVDRLNALGFDFENFGEVVKAIWKGLCDFLAPVFEGVFSQIANILEGVLGVITGIFDIFAGIFTGDWDMVWTGIKEVFGSIWDFIVNTFTTAIKGIANVILGWFGTSWEEVWTGIKDFFVNLWTSISTFFSNIWNGIKNVVTTIMNAIKTVFTTVWNAISTTISTVINTIKNVITTVFNAIKTFLSNIWNGIKTTISTVINAISSTVSNVFNGVKNTISNIFNGIKAVATNVWNGIKTAITTPIEKARDVIKGIIDKIKGFFSGLKLSLPHIKLPHFSIKGSFSLAPPSVPHLAIDWYKKAMDKPMILNGPTIFGRSGNTLLGGGEAGPEVIMGLDMLQSMAEGSNQNLIGVMSQMIAMMSEYFPQFANSTVTLDSGAMVGAMAPQMDAALGKLAMQKGKGW